MRPRQVARLPVEERLLRQRLRQHRLLDPELRRDLWAAFARLAGEGVTLLVSSHVMDEAKRCDDLILMREGRIVAAETPGELRARTGQDDLEEAFLALEEAEDESEFNPFLADAEAAAAAGGGEDDDKG